MITNYVQYRTTKTLLGQFEEAARTPRDRPGRCEEQHDLAIEIAEYEQLRSGATTSFEAGELMADAQPA